MIYIWIYLIIGLVYAIFNIKKVGEEIENEPRYQSYKIAKPTSFKIIKKVTMSLGFLINIACWPVVLIGDLLIGRKQK